MQGNEVIFPKVTVSTKDVQINRCQPTIPNNILRGFQYSPLIQRQQIDNHKYNMAAR